MQKIRKGDEVIVITGKDKGKRGLVQKVVDQAHVLIENVNMVKKHVKPNPAQNSQGGIISKNMPIDISNVAIYNAETKKADRVGFKFIENEGKVRKIRIFKSTQKEVS